MVVNYFPFTTDQQSQIYQLNGVVPYLFVCVNHDSDTIEGGVVTASFSNTFIDFLFLTFDYDPNAEMLD